MEKHLNMKNTKKYKNETVFLPCVWPIDLAEVGTARCNAGRPFLFTVTIREPGFPSSLKLLSNPSVTPKL